MSDSYKRLMECVKSVRAKTDFAPEVALVLGSGLGAYADKINVKAEVAYSEIKDFPVSTVKGHKGKFIFGYVNGVAVCCMQGRVHYYEGYSMEDVVLPIRLMHMLGAKTLILTNAAGGIKTGLRPGDLMLITDQIASFVPSPLRGGNIGELGERFPDMSQVYDKELILQARKCALGMNMYLHEGVYLQLPGPQYETPAEIRMARILGADAVGMSTACEAIAANHMGMSILGISCITNMASGILPVKLTHEEVQQTADKVAKNFEELISRIISGLKR